MTATACRTAALVQCAARTVAEANASPEMYASEIEAYRKGYLVGYRDCAKRLRDTLLEKRMISFRYFDAAFDEATSAILAGLTDLETIWDAAPTGVGDDG